MNGLSASMEIEVLIRFGLKHNLIGKYDVITVRNGLLDLLKIDEPYEGEISEVPESVSPILRNLLDYSVGRGLIPDNTTSWSDLFDTRIMGILMPRQSEVIREFHDIAKDKGIDKATDYFYNLSIDSNYIRMDRIQKNLYWETETDYGPLEITINLSKPEKDPKEIAAARQLPQSNYPKCLLCLDNVGFTGTLNHPARQNLRVIPMNLAGEQWYLQYSPYVYYNEHCIALHSEHIPMKMSKSTFIRLFDFIKQLPHYFIGSNADIPIVGGSILNHEHFQGGRHVFPMEKAKIEKSFYNPSHPGIKAGIIKWPLSTLRLSGKDTEELIEMSSEILEKWREYSDRQAGILAYSNKDGKATPHNTITPIARKNGEGEFEIDLVFRNNRTSDEHPEGIFHPHRELHHIKKENIGLIEVMGLAVLPGRLNTELDEIKDILTGKTAYARGNYGLEHELFKHLPWMEDMIGRYGTCLDETQAGSLLKNEVGLKFLNVLLHAGVYKRDREGQDAFARMMSCLGFTNKK